MKKTYIDWHFCKLLIDIGSRRAIWKPDFPRIISGLAKTSYIQQNFSKSDEVLEGAFCFSIGKAIMNNFAERSVGWENKQEEYVNTYSS